MASSVGQSNYILHTITRYYITLYQGFQGAEELEKIAKALGATYHCYFEFEDGTKI